jgi:cytochrome c-type biogenesis protein CcmF
MTVVVGNFSLSLAVLVALMALLASLGSARLQSGSMLQGARWLIAGFFGLLTLASGALMAGLVNSDFQIEYVSHYTERALPLGYKLAAFWAGQEGSLLLWAWLLSAMSAIAGFTSQAAKNPIVRGRIEW